MPGGKYLANTWQGKFPHQNLCTDGFARTSPVNAFPPNGYGVLDMIGNVWEWTSDFYAPRHEADAPKACCIPENPRGAREQDSFDAGQPNIKIPRGSEGRFASVRPKLLPPVSPGRATCGTGRYLHQSCRLQMRRSERIAAEIDLAVVGEQRAEDVFDVACMFVLSVFVILIDLVVTLVERRLLVWRPTAAEGRG
jgi:hypothetical protein